MISHSVTLPTRSNNPSYDRSVARAEVYCCFYMSDWEMLRENTNSALLFLESSTIFVLSAFTPLTSFKYLLALPAQEKKVRDESDGIRDKFIDFHTRLLLVVF